MTQDKFIRVLNTTPKDLEENVKVLIDDFDTKLVLGFVSPHINFDAISKKIKSLFSTKTYFFTHRSTLELFFSHNKSKLFIGRWKSAKDSY